MCMLFQQYQVEASGKQADLIKGMILRFYVLEVVSA